MKKIYFEIYDITKEPTEWHSAFFGKVRPYDDIMGIVADFAEGNGTDIKNIRLYIYETKKVWEKAFADWQNKVDWELPDYDSI